VLYRARDQAKSRVLAPQVAYLITHILSDAQARAPAFGEGSVLELSRPAAAKTGTTTDWRDNWTIGYTPDVVTGVWVGNANNEPMQRVSGVDGAGPIWHDFMELVLRGQPEREFERPPGLITAEICSLSGLLPTPDCPHTHDELFIAGTEPKLFDSWYQRITVDVTTGLLPNADTPPDRVEARVYAVLPEEAREWAQQQGWPSPPVAVTANSHAVQTAETEIVLTRPDPGSIYRLSPNLPTSAQRIEVSAQMRSAVQLVEMTVFVDGKPLQSFSGPPYRAFWVLEPGEHTFLARGRTADGKSLESAESWILVRESTD
jgi:membrane carboxypeptidase/penicillin-binding protein PbpC